MHQSSAPVLKCPLSALKLFLSPSISPLVRRASLDAAFGDAVYSQLIEAARGGDLEGCIRWFKENDVGVEGGIGVDGPEGYRGSTALAHAASGGSCEVVSLLLQKGADARLPSAPQANALHYAAFKMHKRVYGVLRSSPGGDAAAAARGESQLWGSLGCVTPRELGVFVAREAKEFAESMCDD